MDPQTTNPYQANAQTEDPSGRRTPGIIGRRIERRVLGGATKLAIRTGIMVGRFVLTWFIQTIAVWITILIVSVSTFLITLFAGD